MLKSALLVVSLLCGAGSAHARSSCFSENFRCDNGDVVSLWDKCSGSLACVDGSNETPALCGAPSRNLTAGDLLAATVQYEVDHNSVVFLLCDGQTCNGLWLDGPLGADGEMQYEADSDCNTEGFECNVGHSFDDGTFPAGELVFGVERTASGLSVWLDGHQDRAAFLPAPEGLWQLKVRPGCWNRNMDVSLGGSPAPLASTTASSAQTTQSTTTGGPTTAATSSRSTAARTSASPASAPAETTEALTTVPTPSETTHNPVTTPTAATPSRSTNRPTTKTTAATLSPATDAVSTASTPSQSTDDSWPPTPIPECSPSIPYLLLPSKNGCGEYQVCFSGRTQIMPCTPPLLFHYEIQNCDYPEKVTCYL